MKLESILTAFKIHNNDLCSLINLYFVLPTGVEDAYLCQIIEEPY